MTHRERFSLMRRRVFSFSVLGLLALVVLLGVLRPHGLHSVTEVDSAPARATSSIRWGDAPLLVLAGGVAGFLSGLIGMGGGVLKISFMLLFLRLDIFFARAVSLITMFFSSSSALHSYWKADLIVWPVAARMVVIAVPAVILGAGVGNDLHPRTLTCAFAVFVVFLSFNTFAFVLGDPEERSMTHTVDGGAHDTKGYASAAIGTLHGLACGLLGISGGVIATPAQQLALHMPMRHAIANTLVVSSAVTGIAGVVVAWTGVQRGEFTLDDVLFVDLCMGGGAAAAAPIGALFGERCNVTALRMLFVVLTMAAGLSILL